MKGRSLQAIHLDVTIKNRCFEMGLVGTLGKTFYSKQMVRVPAETAYQLSEVGSCLSDSETFLISCERQPCPYKVRQYLCCTIDFETRRNKVSSTVLQAMDLWNFAIHNNIHLKATHILRVWNELADRFSRNKVMVTEGSLHKSVVLLLFQTWGFPLIDLFASAENRQTHIFGSWIPHPEA